MSHTKKLSSSGGFTIMEVALAATVLALTLVGMIQVIDSGSEMLDLSRKQTIAAQILHGEIDELRLQSWTNISTYPVFPAVTTFSIAAAAPTPPALIPPYDPAFSSFAPLIQNWRNLSFTRSVVPLTPPLLQITFTVGWTGMNGHPYYRSSITYVSQNGLNAAYQGP